MKNQLILPAQFIGKRVYDFPDICGLRIVIMMGLPGKFPFQVFDSAISGDIAPDIMFSTIKDCVIDSHTAKILI